MQQSLKPTKWKIAPIVLFMLFLAPLLLSNNQTNQLLDLESFFGVILILWWTSAWWLSIVFSMPFENLFEKYNLIVGDGGWMGFKYLTPVGIIILILIYAILFYIITSFFQSGKKR